MFGVVVVTGASAGVGRATARAFATAGVDAVALMARGEAGLEGAVADVEGLGARALALPVDVADAEAVEAAAARVEDELGPIDVWVNNAMATVFAPVWETTPEEYARATAVTYLGYVHGTLAALRRMRPRDRGTIVQVGSALAYRAIPLQSAYCASKFAVRGFTDSLRTELRHERSGVDVTMVQLPGLNTPQFEWSRSRMPRHPRPVAPVFQPEVAADAVVWAAGHPRREYRVGGRAALTITAEKLVPGLLDRYLARTAVTAQQTDEPVGPGRRDDLFEPVDDDADHGAHGRFDDGAVRASRLWRLTQVLTRRPRCWAGRR